MSNPTITEQNVAAAMTDELNIEELREIAYQDNLKTIGDMNEWEFKDTYDAYYGEIAKQNAIKAVNRINKQYAYCQACGGGLALSKHDD